VCETAAAAAIPRALDYMKGINVSAIYCTGSSHMRKTMTSGLQ
jgi:hypothetical protein